MRHRSIKSRAGRVMLGAVLAGALSGAGANFARADGLSLDIEAGSGNPNAPVNTVTVAPGSTTTFNVFAVVTDTTNTPSTDGLGGLFAAFDASSTTAGALGSLTASTPTSPFNYSSPSVASAGTTYSAFSDGTNTHVGTGAYNGGTSSTLSSDFNSATPTGWFFAAYLTNSGGNISSIDNTGIHLTAGNGEFFPIGTLSFVAGSSTGTATVTGVGRTQVSNNMVAALWSENGVTETPATGAAITSDSLTVTIGTPVTAHNGDTMPYDGHTVGLTDLNNVLNNLGTTNPAGYAWPDTAANDSSPVGLTDLNLVYNNLGQGNSAIIAAPEPASLGLLGLGALAMIRRRSRN